MMGKKSHLLWPLAFVAGLGVTALSSGCVVRARPARVTVRTPTVTVAPATVVVRVRPPAPRVEVRRACPAGSYWKTGRWQYNGRRWVWLAGGCKAYPRGRAGCRWTAGRWVKTRRGWRWTAGRWRCTGHVTVRPRRPVVTVTVPRIAPPAPPKITVKACPPTHYWKPGRYEWRGRWIWVAGHCVMRPIKYRRPTCTWMRGRWTRTPRGWKWNAGHWQCQGATVQPSGGPVVTVTLPKIAPPRPPRVRVRRCRRSHYWKPGRYEWHGRWVWIKGQCIRRPPTFRKPACRWAPGRWTRTPRGWKWNAGHWMCHGRRVVVKSCPRGMIRIKGVCKRAPNVRCPAGTHRVAGRGCIPTVRACPRGMIRIKGVCKRAPNVRCRTGTHYVAGKGCIAAFKACPKGMLRIHGVCKRARRCPRGTVLRHGACITINKNCPVGTTWIRGACRRARFERPRRDR